MAFKPKKTYSDKDAREQQSIDFINGLLKGTSAYPELKYGEKGANIDGYIQLLDEEKCIDGKLTAQVKTVLPCDEGKYVYDCPTSLFAYAERTLDVVFLMAVDHSLGVVLWKYISRQLINENQDKSEQKTITMHFDVSERLTKDNIPETIERWKSLFLKQRNLVTDAEGIKEENDLLRQQLVTAEASGFTIPKTEVAKVQQFSDTYNGLLDREFKYVKRCCYPNAWKQGIVILNYQDTELLYATYSIHYGENSLLIKQLPIETLRKIRYEYASHSVRENKIKNDIPALVKERITEDVNRIFKIKNLPAYENYIIEYVEAFVYENHNALGVPRNVINDYQALKKAIEQYCMPFGKIPFVAKIGSRRMQIELIYDCISYLLNRGYQGTVELYPPKGRYGDTGMVSDWFTPERAYEKMKIVHQYVYATYTDFIEKNFPDIKEQLDMYEGADFVLINFNYESNWPHIMINYLYNTNPDRRKSRPKVEFCFEQEHEIYKQYGHKSHKLPYVENKISYKGEDYECRIWENADAHKYLFNRTCFIDVFYDVFKRRLEEYVEKMPIKV